MQGELKTSVASCALALAAAVTLLGIAISKWPLAGERSHLQTHHEVNADADELHRCYGPALHRARMHDHLRREERTDNSTRVSYSEEAFILALRNAGKECGR